MAAAKAKKQIDVTGHVLIPKHSKISDKEKKELFDAYHIQVMDLPRISIHDPVLLNLDVKPGDVVKIERISSTAKQTAFFRGVSDA